jgi:predicted Zn-dependent protease
MDELQHHGIKGMKWGVRRYQNKDGSLTPAGKKRYNSMTGDQLYKNLKKGIHKERARQYGWSNQWMSSKAIGDNSKKAIEARDNAIKQAKNTPEYKKARAEYDKLWKQIESQNYAPEDYEKILAKYDKAAERLSSVSKSSELGRVAICRAGGFRYANEFLNGHGKDISIGYLKDMGFDDSDARRYVDKMIKSGWTLGGL